MRYYVTLAGRTIEVDLTGEKPRLYGVEVDADLAKDRAWEVGDSVPAVFGKTGAKDLVIGGTYAENQIAGSYLVSLETYEENYSQRLDQVVAMTVTPDADVSEAVKIMREKALRRLPVVDDGRPVGIVSLGDLAIEEDPNSALADISEAAPND